MYWARQGTIYNVNTYTYTTTSVMQTIAQHQQLTMHDAHGTPALWALRSFWKSFCTHTQQAHRHAHARTHTCTHAHTRAHTHTHARTIAVSFAKERGVTTSTRVIKRMAPRKEIERRVTQQERRAQRIPSVAGAIAVLKRLSTRSKESENVVLVMW